MLLAVLHLYLQHGLQAGYFSRELMSRNAILYSDHNYNRAFLSDKKEQLHNKELKYHITSKKCPSGHLMHQMPLISQWSLPCAATSMIHNPLPPCNTPTLLLPQAATWWVARPANLISNHPNPTDFSLPLPNKSLLLLSDTMTHNQAAPSLTHPAIMPLTNSSTSQWTQLRDHQYNS